MNPILSVLMLLHAEVDCERSLARIERVLALQERLTQLRGTPTCLKDDDTDIETKTIEELLKRELERASKEIK